MEESKCDYCENQGTDCCQLCNGESDFELVSIEEIEIDVIKIFE